MYALDPKRRLAFMYDPLEGLSIPLVLDAPRRKYRVEYPSVDDIHHNFSVFASLEDMIDFAPDLSRNMRQLADRDRHWSAILSKLIEDDTTTTKQLGLAIREVEARKHALRRSRIVHWAEAQDEAMVTDEGEYASAQDYVALKSQMS